MRRRARSAGLALALCIVLTGAVATRAQEEGEAAPAAARPAYGLHVRSIKEFGPTGTPAEAEAAYRKALEELTARDGGILVVPEDVPKRANLENTARWSHSIDPSSCDLRDWKVGPGVLVIDNRQGSFTLRVPQLGGLGSQVGSGLNLARTLRLPPAALPPAVR